MLTRLHLSIIRSSIRVDVLSIAVHFALSYVFCVTLQFRQYNLVLFLFFTAKHPLLRGEFNTPSAPYDLIETSQLLCVDKCSRTSRTIINTMETNANMVDLTVEPKNHLAPLPTELLHMIIGYLFPNHEPDKAFESDSTDLDKSRPASHSLDFLAATCRSLRGEVNSWARVFLIQHRDITKYKSLKTAKLQAQRNFLRGRGGLLAWTEKHCVFCGKPSSRSAILMNGLRCCNACDKIQWPEKITKSDARRVFDLKDHHLLPHLHSAGKLLMKHPGLPKLRYGTYMSSNVPTTIFLKKDVGALARLAHGDLKAHLAKRQADREERSRKLQATKARREEENARWIAEKWEVEGAKYEAEYDRRQAEASTSGANATNPVLLSDDESSLIGEATWLNEDLDLFVEDGEFELSFNRLVW